MKRERASNSLHLISQDERGECIMAAAQEKANKSIDNDVTVTTKSDDPRVITIDRTAPAGSENSLGAESVRDGRPATDDSIVEAIDEVGPEFTAPIGGDKSESSR
jgi:hypothetical protein